MTAVLERTFKRCGTCKASRPGCDFSPDASRPSGLASRCRRCKAAHYQRNREAIREQQKGYYQANREAIIASVQRYATTHREEKAAYDRAYNRRHKARKDLQDRRWREANSDRKRVNDRLYRAANRDRLNLQIEQWRGENPDRARRNSRASDARRRARLVDAPSVHFTAAQLDLRLSMFGYRCWMCGEPGVEVDHVKPLARGGSHMLSNLRPACRSCNRSKSATWPYGSAA